MAPGHDRTAPGEVKRFILWSLFALVVASFPAVAFFASVAETARVFVKAVQSRAGFWR